LRGRGQWNIPKAAGLLEQTLEEEKAADEKLTSLAEGGINEQAARVAHGGEQESEDNAPDEVASGKSLSNGSSASQSTTGKKRVSVRR
jgi:hypothetical protein